MNGTKTTLGERISDIRTGAGLTQAEFSQRLGITRELLSKLETDSRKPKLEVLEEISSQFKVSLYYLITGISEENHDIGEDLGLSDKSIETIRFYKKHEWQNNSLNALISDNQLMNHILYYLSEEYDELRIWDEDEGMFFWKKIEDVWNLHPGDLERIERLRIMDHLKRLKDSIKEERENGKTGKR